ncbi:putative secologanin synthase [Helianthus annuus]|nr:putative secologanin synthase [Helianthus annuus]KAJ0504964.1 putative secologanin synthase [Helianthus annuus]
MDVNTICYVVCIMLVSYALRLLNLMWFKPKKMEKFLRDQGLDGRDYKFPFGDLKELMQSIVEAKTKPIDLTDDIVPRVLPFVHEIVATHGMCKCL